MTRSHRSAARHKALEPTGGRAGPQKVNWPFIRRGSAPRSTATRQTTHTSTLTAVVSAEGVSGVVLLAGVRTRVRATTRRLSGRAALVL
jgi:hypothetical protein